MTKREAVDAAMGLAEDVAEGRLDPAVLEQQAVAELRELFGEVVGPDSPAWPTQLEVARGVLAAGGLGLDEQSEWLAVARHKAGEPLRGLGPAETLSEPIPLPGAAHSPENADTGPDLGPDDDLADVPREVLVEAEAAALAVITRYRAGRDA
jgi:hypothetical protein